MSLDGSFQVFVISKEVALILSQKMLDHTKTDLDVRVTGKRIWWKINMETSKKKITDKRSGKQNISYWIKLDKNYSK